MADWIYERDGDVYAPSEWAGSPWSAEMQHGGPVNALFARSVEQAGQESGLQVARLTVDLFRPVPVRPLRLGHRAIRQGRRLAALDLELRDPDSDEVLTRASAVLLKPTAELSPSWGQGDSSPSRHDDLPKVEFMPRAYRNTTPPGFHWSLELRAAAEGDELTWIHTPLDLVRGEPTTPLQRMAAVADLTFGLSGRMLFARRRASPEVARVAFINTDTTIYLERPPVGDWFAFRPGLLTDRDGVGLADVELLDEHGRLGRSLQALLANPGNPGGG